MNVRPCIIAILQEYIARYVHIYKNIYTHINVARNFALFYFLHIYLVFFREVIFFYIYKATVQWHRKRNRRQSNRIKMTCRFQFMSSAHISIIKKKYKKKIGRHKPNPVNPHKVYANPIRWYKEIKNNIGGCLTCKPSYSSWVVEMEKSLRCFVW